MLVLSRKIGQTIVIDGGIRLTITAIRGKQARVAIDAPREIAILRDEIPRWIVPGLGPTAHGLRPRGGRSEPARARTAGRQAR
jgi:carbon storage regulator